MFTERYKRGLQTRQTQFRPERVKAVRVPSVTQPFNI